jgi:putative DNA primase/helicase
MVEAVDLDSIVDYRMEYEPYVKKAKVSGDNMTGICPFHDDRNASFSVDLKTGKWHCFAEDIGGNFIDFWAKVYNTDTKEAYKQICEKYNILMPTPEDKEKRRVSQRSFSVKQYAFQKHLPEEWLRETCHISDDKDKDGTTYMKIPYLKPDGTLATFRKRYANKEFRWRYGSSGKIIMYGEWQLEKIRKAGYVCLVEGESDSQSMWQMGISCLGIPGASMFKPDMADRLQDLKVYIHQEPDQGGQTFLQKVTDGLIKGGFIGKVYKFQCSSIAGHKDPSELFMELGPEKASKKIMKLLEGAKEIDLSKPETTVPEAISGAPVNLRQPEGWIYSDQGISHIDEKTYGPVLVCRTPIILTQRLKSLETGEEKIEIAFKRDGEWKTAIFPRSTIFTSKSITTLADLGCTVTSENAKMLVRFLSALEAENIDIIQKSDATSTFGWQPGKRFIPGHDQGIVLDIDPSQRGMAAAYCQTGTLEGWVETMRPHRERDTFRFIMAASFAAPLLRIIKQRIFFVYNWGSSKGGKTAGLKAALSAWGDPERLMVNFNATQVGLERIAAFYCDLPLGIDERQLAGKNQDSLEKIVYMISSGTGKIRGAKGGGLQTTSQWRTVALATGEEPLSTETTQTGVSSRVLEIYGGPFESEQQAGLMHQQCMENFGYAGPEFVRRLFQVTESSIQEKYSEMLKYVNGIAKGKSGSHIAGISAVALADAMIDTWIFSEDAPAAEDEPEGQEKSLEIKPESWERAKRMAESILKAQIDSEAADVNENAVQFITDWVLSNKGYFGEKAIGTCLGDINESASIAWIYPSLLTEALKKAGFSPRKTLKYMADRGILKMDKDGKHMSVQRRFNGAKTRMIEIHMEGDNEDDVESAADDFEPISKEVEEALPF